MAKTVMILGLGWVGYWASQFLARCEGLENVKFVTSQRDDQAGSFRTNLAYVGSLYAGTPKEFEFYRNDLNDIDATAKLLESAKPDVILCSVAFQLPSALMDGSLPKEVQVKLMKPGLNLWLPWQFVLIYKLMKAMEKAGIEAPIVNASLADVTNVVMWRHFGFGPRVGVGNLDIIALRIAHHVAKTERVHLHDVQLHLVAPYAILHLAPKQGINYFLKITVKGNDMTRKYDADQLIAASGPLKLGADPTIPFSATYPWVSSSAVQKVLAILNDANEFMHGNGPDGRPGGYPIRLSAKRAEIVLPPELTLERAIRINEDGFKLQGIEKIDEKGTVHYTEATYNAMKEIGYDCKELSLDEVESRAAELKVLYKKFTGK